MQTTFAKLLENEIFDKDAIHRLLMADADERRLLFKKAAEIKQKYVGNKVYYRGLIEFSNICSKNCLYCGIRAGNKETQRYELDDNYILEAAKFALENRYASIVLQAGERTNTAFIEKVNVLLSSIKQMSNGKLGITLSLGEQSTATYKEWFNLGGHRYLLRIETSNRELYRKIHPEDKWHDFENRIHCLRELKNIGYQTGTGVMIGLPFQTVEDLADDVIFFRDTDTDMVGMGPFIEHSQTPLFEFRQYLWPLNDRFQMALKMVAVLRIVMKDINIAAATALQAIDPMGREKALKVGANIIMPNITPTTYRKDYQLYENKPCIDEGASDCSNCLEARIHLVGDQIGFDEWGDSVHYQNRIH